MSNSITLTIGTERILAQEVSITKTINAICDTFTLKIPFKTLAVHQPVKVRVNNLDLMTGYTNQIEHATPANNNTTTLVGRSMSQDIVDSRITYTAHNTTMDAIASELFAKFGQTFSALVETKEVDEFAIVAESAFEALNQLAKEQNLLLIENNDGTVNLVEPANVDNTHIKLDASNLSDFRINEDLSVFFYENTAKSNPGKFNLNAPEHNNPQFTVYLDPIRTTRVQEIISDQLKDEQDCQDRVNEVIRLAKAQSIRASGTSKGWFAPDGKLWQINSTYTINGVMLLLDTAVFNQSGNNRTTSLKFKGHYVG
jgi:prophage tail gpP-like protein